jgi:hypothetical protein
MNDTDRLSARIEAAFASRARPPEPMVAHESSSDPEVFEVATVFAGRARESLSLDFIESQAQSLFFLKPEALAYYLPAYLRACLSSPDNTSNAFDAVVFGLGAMREGAEWASRFREMWRLLSPAERAAVADFEALAQSEAS